MTVNEFEEMVRRHDLTHMYSDDGDVWRRGNANLQEIREAAQRLPREDVERIWNTIVDSKLIDSARSQFYWRWPADSSGVSDMTKDHYTK